MSNKNDKEKQEYDTKEKKNVIMSSTIFILVLLSVYLISSCMNYPDTYMTDWYTKIRDWQYRQTKCYDYPEPQTVDNFYFTHLTLSYIRYVALDNFLSAPEDVDYWETSCEAWENEEGDCDTFAFGIWGLLREVGFPDDLIRLLVVKVAENHHHMVVAVYYTADEFYVIDNGAFTSNVLTGKEYLDRFQLEPVVEFNLFSYWDFR